MKFLTILIFIRCLNFMLSEVEHEISSITYEQGIEYLELLEMIVVNFYTWPL